MTNASLSGEVIAPRQLIIPTKTLGATDTTGSIKLSGARVLLYDGNVHKNLGVAVSTTTVGNAGDIVLSGSHILIHNGTNFVQLSGSNVA